MMKIIIYVLVALLVATLGAAAGFYFQVYMPLEAQYAQLKTSMTELDKTKATLKKYKEKEAQETAWIGPVMETLSTGLAEEIKSGKAEVLTTGGKVVVNITEQSLYVPGSYTFSQESPKLRANLASLLKNDKIKGKYIYVGNTTSAVPAQLKGRKKIPGKDARTLAAERSAVLVKDFVEKYALNQESLISVAYSSTSPEIGSKIKDHKTSFILENPSIAMATQGSGVSVPEKTEPVTKSTQTVTTAAPSVSPVQPKPIPIKPAQPQTK